MLNTRIRRWPYVYVCIYVYNNIDKKKENEEQHEMRRKENMMRVIANVNGLLLDYRQHLNHE